MESSGTAAIDPLEIREPLEVRERRKWITVYPIYINSKKSSKEGRRISVARGVENPTASEIFEVCKYLKLEAEVQQDKCYPRDFYGRGRVKVKLSKDDGTVSNPETPTKMQLLIKLAALIKKLSSRASSSKAGGSTSASAPASSSSAKSGKKGKRK
mmetsp:Transcript_22572/g.37253  ORF Transcript_22572/g.37253 Transcript_22572/m.37253 type:complete len:156 (-) Transcript_22572:405-872(-)